MKLSFASTTLLAAVASAAPLLKLRSVNFDFNSQKVRGVNLGGWLVLEPWITPSLWKQWASNPGSGPVDEYHLTQTLGKDAATSLLTSHYESFYSLDDFKAMQSAGLNTVRIPIGYWGFTLNSGDPYVTGQEKYLDRAIGWARQTQIKVWIDLHGAPGSQNGFDNSGIRDQIKFQQGDSTKQTLAVLKKIAQKYAQQEYQDVVVAIELLNEPLGSSLDLDALTQFYKDGFGETRDVSDTFIVMHDAFQEVGYWNGVLSDGGNNALIDHHHYQVFTEDQVASDAASQISGACGSYGEIDGADHYVVVGEFSGAMTDCARWLNGWNRGNRYEGSYQSSASHGSCASKGEISQMSDTDKQNTRKFVEAQLDTFEKKAGWIFWTWKAEEGNNNDDWNMSKMLSNGLFPKPVDKRQYPGQCS